MESKRRTVEGLLRLEYGDDGLSKTVFDLGESGVADNLKGTLEVDRHGKRVRTTCPFVLGEQLGFLEYDRGVPVHGRSRLTGLRGGVTGMRRFGDLDKGMSA